MITSSLLGGAGSWYSQSLEFGGRLGGPVSQVLVRFAETSGPMQSWPAGTDMVSAAARAALRTAPDVWQREPVVLTDGLASSARAVAWATWARVSYWNIAQLSEIIPRTKNNNNGSTIA